MSGWKATNCEHIWSWFWVLSWSWKALKFKENEKEDKNRQKVLSTSFREKIAKFVFEIAKCRQIYSIRRKISSNCLLWSFDLLIWFVAVNIRILKIDKIRILAGRSLARFFFFSLSKYSVSFTNFERKCRNFCCCQIVKLKVCRESTYYIRQSTCACLLSMSRADSLARPLPCFWCLSLGSSNTQCRILEKKVFKNCLCPN